MKHMGFSCMSFDARKLIKCHRHPTPQRLINIKNAANAINCCGRRCQWHMIDFRASKGHQKPLYYVLFIEVYWNFFGVIWLIRAHNLYSIVRFLNLEADLPICCCRLYRYTVNAWLMFHKIPLWSIVGAHYNSTCVICIMWLWLWLLPNNASLMLHLHLEYVSTIIIRPYLHQTTQEDYLDFLKKKRCSIILCLHFTLNYVIILVF